MTNEHNTERSPRYPTAAELHPRVRNAIAMVVADRWDEALADYVNQPADERDGHLWQHVNALHNFLDAYSPLRFQEDQQ